MLSGAKKSYADMIYHYKKKSQQKYLNSILNYIIIIVRIKIKIKNFQNNQPLQICTILFCVIFYSMAY